MGVLLPARTPRLWPWVRRIAAVTVFAFTLTSILPAGIAAPTHDSNTLRGEQTLEGKPEVKSGLEEKLTVRAEPVEAQKNVTPSSPSAQLNLWQRRMAAGKPVGGFKQLALKLLGAAMLVAGTAPTLSSQENAQKTPAGPQQVTVDTSQLNALPYRAKPTFSQKPPTEGPGIVGNVAIQEDLKNRKTPLKAVVKQTFKGQPALATPTNFSRSPEWTAASRIRDFVGEGQAWVRRTIYGTENGSHWTAAKNPAKVFLQPGMTTGFTVWKPERLHLLGPDQEEAVFRSIGEGATEAGAQAVMLYETNWSVTLMKAQAEKGDVPRAVLEKVRRHIDLARKYGIKIWPLYSGVEGLRDVDTMVQHLVLATDQGFDRQAVITDVEPWAERDGPWMKALGRMKEAETKGDARGVSKARQELLQISASWMRTHQETLNRVVPADRAFDERQAEQPKVFAFVQPAFVPVLKVAMVWHQLEQQAKQNAYDLDKLWSLFDQATSKPWSEEQLDQVLQSAGFKFDKSLFQAQLPDRLQLVVMAYAYPNGSEPEAVAAQMEMAYAGGFGGSLGLTVNLEWEDDNISLASRSERAGEIVEKIIQKLRTSSKKTGFDGRTLFVHLPDELSLSNMARNGAQAWPRRLTPKRSDAISATALAIGQRMLGIPKKGLREQRWIPGQETAKEWGERQAIASMWGLGVGVTGIGPWYANYDNLHTWIVKYFPSVHPDTGPFGPELGMGERGFKLLTGALASGEARVTNMDLRLIKRGPDGKIAQEYLFRHIPGKNSPIISDKNWDEAELLVTVHRVKDGLGPVLFMDMAAKMERRHPAPSDMSPESWAQVFLMPKEAEATIPIKLPGFASGANSITLLTQDASGQVVEWQGSGQDPLYLTPHAPFIADNAKKRMDAAKIELEDLRVQRGKPRGYQFSPEELWEMGRHDLITDQEALRLTSLGVLTGGRAEVMAMATISEKMEKEPFKEQLAQLKQHGVTSLVVNIPTLEKEIGKALRSSDQGVRPFTGEFFRRHQVFSDLADLVQEIHRYGIRVHLLFETDELVQIAHDLAQASQKKSDKARTEEMVMGDLLRLLFEANQHGKWSLDVICFNAPPNPYYRSVLERVVREGLQIPMTFIGKEGSSSQQSLFAHTLALQPKNQQAVLQEIDKILNVPSPVKPREHRFPTAILLKGPSLSETVTWLDALSAVRNDPKVEQQFLYRLKVPDDTTLKELGYSREVRAQVKKNAPDVEQEQLTQAWKAHQQGKPAEPWAVAMVQGKAEELIQTTQVTNLETYGTPFDSVLLQMYGIQLSPLVLTEAQRAEILPLVPMHMAQVKGSTWLGVQVKNPADPDSVKSPAVYDVEVHVDYPSWMRYPTAIHKKFTMTLMPGETAPAWVELTGLPKNEDSRVVRVRVVPRTAEFYRPGSKASTRSDEEQALELTGFIIHGDPSALDLQTNWLEEWDTYLDREGNWRQVYGLRQDAPEYQRLRDEYMRAYFGIGTELARARLDPKTGQIEPIAADPVSRGKQEAGKLREKLENWKEKLLTTVEPEPERPGLRWFTWLIEMGAKIGLIVVGIAYLVGMLRGYRQSGEIRRAYQRMGQAAVRVNMGPYIPSQGGVTRLYSVTQEEVVRIGPRVQGLPSEPAVVHREQGKVPRAMEAFDKDHVIVAGDAVEQESQNIQRTPLDPFSRKRPGTVPTPEQEEQRARRSAFQRSVPTVVGMSLLGGAAALLLGAPVALVAAGVGFVAAGIAIAARSQSVQQSAGDLMTLPARIAGSAALNSPAVVVSFSGVALVGAVGLSVLLGAPLFAVSAAALAWCFVGASLSGLEPWRLPGALGITGLGAAVLVALFSPVAMLSVEVLSILAITTLVITHRALLRWLEGDQPVEGLLRSVWSTLSSAVKWGLIAAAVYGIFAVAHPLLWTGVLELPWFGVLWKAGIGLEALFSVPASAALGWMAGGFLFGAALLYQAFLAWRTGEGFNILNLLLVAVVVPATYAGSILLLGMAPTIGLLVVGVTLLLNLSFQARLNLNGWTKTGTAKRDPWSLVLSGIGLFGIVGACLWFWGVVPAAAALAYICVWGIIAQTTSLGMLGWVAASAGLRRFVERVDRVERSATEERHLDGVDPVRYAEARQRAANDKVLQAQYGTGSFTDVEQPGEQLSARQWMLINRYYWMLLAIDEANPQGDTPDDTARRMAFQGLSEWDQQRLINLYFTEHFKAHKDTIIGEDAGTTLRTLLYGIWTGRMREVVRTLRNEDRLVVTMPALILSLAWARGDAWKRAGDSWRLRLLAIPWELASMLVASFAVPLGFFASMGNRTAGAVFSTDSNMANPLRIRGDAGLSGYREIIFYVLNIMGRWLVGHIYILMRAFLGRRVSRDVAELLFLYRWDRKQGTVRERINHLTSAAEDLWQGGNIQDSRRLMGTALYAALTGDKNLSFDVGRSETPDSFEEEEWNETPDEDHLYDDSYYGDEFNRGTLAGVVAQRYDVGGLRGVHVYYPTKVEWKKATGKAAGVGRLSPTPGKFRIQMEFGGHPKSRLADASLQYFQGRLTPEPVIQQVAAGLEEGAATTHRLRIRFVSEEARAFPQIQEAREAIENPRNRFTGIRRQEGVVAADAVAVHRHERLSGARLGSDQDRVALFQGELGHDAYRDQQGLWYQLRLNFFGAVRRWFLGLNSAGTPSAGRIFGRWMLSLAAGFAFAWATSSIAAGLGLVIAPWLLGILYGTLIPLSFMGLGIQDTIIQGMKGHYDSGFLETAMDGFFEGTLAADRGTLNPAAYDALLGRGIDFILADSVLARLIGLYPRLMHPEHPGYKLTRFQRADPADVRMAKRLLKGPVSRDRWNLRRQVRDEILKRIGDQIKGDVEGWRAFREAFTRNTQMELAAIGNYVGGIQYHRSRNRDVFRAGDENDQFATDGQEPLVRMMIGLGVAPVRDRSWARTSMGAFYGGVRMPSMMYSQTSDQGIQNLLQIARREGFIVEAAWRDQEGSLHCAIRYDADPNDMRYIGNPDDIIEKDFTAYLKVAYERLDIPRGNIPLVRSNHWDRREIPSGAIRRILPIQAYREQGAGRTVNQFMLANTHLQPDLEATNQFLREESIIALGSLNVDNITVDQADRYLASREIRLGLPSGTFLRFSELGWTDEQLRQALGRLRGQGTEDGGDVYVGAARPLSVQAREWLERGRWWVTAVGLAVGVFGQPWGWFIAAIAGILGLSSMQTGMTSLLRFTRADFWRKAIVSHQEPYSDEIILMQLLYGATKDQVVRDSGGRVVDLRWSSADGLYDSSHWRAGVGSYLFPGTRLARILLWERRGLKIHAPPVPYLALVRLFEEAPWLASASGFNRLPTDAFELGESFAEDTLFGLYNLHRQDPELQLRLPTLNAFNVHKPNYLFGQQELRKRDEATTRAIQLFKGMTMAQAGQYLLDSPLFDSYRQTVSGSVVQGLFGWDSRDPLEQRPSGQSIFGMEAFRRDEATSAGARGAGTFSYGYTGFTASDLFSRRVGPFAPGDAQAYWTYRYYEELDARLGGEFFQTLHDRQRHHQPRLPPMAEPTLQVLLQGLTADPFVILTEAGTRLREQQRRTPPPLDPVIRSFAQEDPEAFARLLQEFPALIPDMRRAFPNLPLQPLAQSGLEESGQGTPPSRGFLSRMRKVQSVEPPESSGAEPPPSAAQNAPEATVREILLQMSLQKTRSAAGSAPNNQAQQETQTREGSAAQERRLQALTEQVETLNAQLAEANQSAGYARQFIDRLQGAVKQLEIEREGLGRQIDELVDVIHRQREGGRILLRSHATEVHDLQRQLQHALDRSETLIQALRREGTASDQQQELIQRQMRMIEAFATEIQLLQQAVKEYEEKEQNLREGIQVSSDVPMELTASGPASAEFSRSFQAAEQAPPGVQQESLTVGSVEGSSIDYSVGRDVPMMPVAALEKDLEAERLLRAEADEQLRQVGAQLQALQDSMSTQESQRVERFELLKREAEEAGERAAAAGKRVGELEQSQQKLMVEVERQEDEFNRREAELAWEKAARAEAEGRARKSEKTLQGLKASMTEQEAQRAETFERLSREKEEAKERAAVAGGRVTELEQNRHDLGAEVERQRVELERVRAELEQERDAGAKATRRAAAAEARETALDQRRRELEAEIGRQGHELGRLGAELAQERAVRAVADARARASEEALQELQASMTEQEAQRAEEFAQLRREAKETRERATAVEARETALDQRRQELEAEIERQDNELGRLGTELAQEKAARNKAQAVLQQTSDEVRDLKNKFEMELAQREAARARREKELRRGVVVAGNTATISGGVIPAALTGSRVVVVTGDASAQGSTTAAAVSGESTSHTVGASIPALPSPSAEAEARAAQAQARADEAEQRYKEGKRTFDQSLRDQFRKSEERDRLLKEVNQLRGLVVALSPQTICQDFKLEDLPSSKGRRLPATNLGPVAVQAVALTHPVKEKPLDSFLLLPLEFQEKTIGVLAVISGGVTKSYYAESAGEKARERIEKSIARDREVLRLISAYAFASISEATERKVQLQNKLQEVLRAIHQELFDYDPDGIGRKGEAPTSLEFALIVRDTLFLSHLGDNRTYRIQRGGSFGLLTDDDTSQWDQVKQQNPIDQSLLLPQQRLEITRKVRDFKGTKRLQCALGGPNPAGDSKILNPDQLKVSFIEEIKEGDQFWLVTNGVTSSLLDEKIREASTVEEVLREVVSLQKGAPEDDATAIRIQVRRPGVPPAAPVLPPAPAPSPEPTPILKATPVHITESGWNQPPDARVVDSWIKWEGQLGENYVQIVAGRQQGERSNQEDNFTVEVLGPQEVLLVVADGMGGGDAGEVASRMVVDGIREGIKAPESRQLAEEYVAAVGTQRSALQERIKDRLRMIFDQVNQDVQREQKARNQFRENKMGSTAVAAWVIGNDAFVTNAGDSRALYFQDGQLRQMTPDHNMAWVFAVKEVEHREVSDYEPGLPENYDQIADEARRQPLGNVLVRFLGDSIEGIPVGVVHLKQNDILTLCTDGIIGPVSNSEIKLILEHLQGEPPDAVAQTLMKRAAFGDGAKDLPRGLAGILPSPDSRGKESRNKDNATVIVMVTSAGLEEKAEKRNTEQLSQRLGLLAEQMEAGTNPTPEQVRQVAQPLHQMATDFSNPDQAIQAQAVRTGLQRFFRQRSLEQLGQIQGVSHSTDTSKLVVLGFDDPSTTAWAPLVAKAGKPVAVLVEDSIQAAALKKLFSDARIPPALYAVGSKDNFDTLEQLVRHFRSLTGIALERIRPASSIEEMKEILRRYGVVFSTEDLTPALKEVEGYLEALA